MEKKKLNLIVEEYINNKRDELVSEFESATKSYDQFIWHTAKRLRHSFDMYQKKECNLADFLISLRDYLLTLQVNLSLDTISIPADNEYGITKDPSKGKYFATYQLPSYVNHTFVEAAFLKEYQPYKDNNRGFDLHTDMQICKITGFKYFKSSSQKLAVYGALNTPDGYTTLVSLPTGGGKSLISQSIAYQKSGLTIIIVPTVSLAIDQVRVAKGIIKSTHIDEEVFSYNSGVDAAPILKAIKKKTAKMLFISPEALINNPGFIDVVENANATRFLKNIIIDEAHIVVDWGASFRVDYQCLESWRRKLMLSNPSIRTILLSATFEQHCISILKDFFSQNAQKWIEIRCDSLRHEPRYMLVRTKSYTDKNIKMVELVRKMPHPMIIYVARPEDATTIESILFDNDIKNVRTFTGLTTSVKREELINAWADDQFEIMIATSAFGVGVDKSDVRTVLHMYIPQNANAYYQELGRGGRDSLPCLSIMCTDPNDLNISFGRISKKVMTTEKIVGRWNSMYNSENSSRIVNHNYIDTSVKPSYAAVDVMDDTPTSDADMNWNIYVILFLRRYGLIKVHEVIPQTTKYIFDIEILVDTLRTNDEHQTELIARHRSMEWSYYVDSFESMKTAIAIKNSENVCWSEMFYEAYDKVSEYCAGCNAHTEVNEGDFMDYPLKSPVKEPVKVLEKDQLAIFSGSESLIVIPRQDEKIALIESLSKYRLSVYVSSDDTDTRTFLSNMTSSGNVLVINEKDLRELVKRRSFYYISGLIAVKYHGAPRKIYDLLKYITSNLGNCAAIKIIHILEENTYFEWLNKVFTDLVDGPVVPANSIIS